MKFFIALLLLFSFKANSSNLARCQLYLLVDIAKMYPVQIELPMFKEGDLEKPYQKGHKGKKATWFKLTRSAYEDVPDALTGASASDRRSAGLKIAFSPIILPLTLTIDAIFITPFQLIREAHRARKSKAFKKAMKQYGKKYEQEYNLALGKLQGAFNKIKGSKWKIALLKKKLEVLQLFTTVRRMKTLADNSSVYEWGKKWTQDYYLNWLLNKMKAQKLVSDNITKDSEVLKTILSDLNKTIHKENCGSFPTIEKYFAAYKAI